METNVQPSFIPKKPVTPAGPKPVHTTSFFSIIATVLFITSLVVAMGVYGYKFFLNKSIDTKQAALQKELDKFEAKNVQTLYRLENKMTTASDLLKNHFSTTVLLNMLGKITLKNIQYDSFTFTAGENQRGLILLQGKALNFTAIALQADIFNDQKSDAQKYFKNIAILNPSLDKEGTVTFSATADVDMTQVTYPLSLDLTDSGVSLTATNPISGTSTAATTTKSTTH